MKKELVAPIGFFAQALGAGISKTEKLKQIALRSEEELSAFRHGKRELCSKVILGLYLVCF